MTALLFSGASPSASRRAARKAGIPARLRSSASTAVMIPAGITGRCSPELQRIRGPYPMEAGIAAYAEHLGLAQHPPGPITDTG